MRRRHFQWCAIAAPRGAVRCVVVILAFHRDSQPLCCIVQRISDTAVLPASRVAYMSVFMRLTAQVREGRGGDVGVLTQMLQAPDTASAVLSRACGGVPVAAAWPAVVDYAVEAFDEVSDTSVGARARPRPIVAC